MSFLWKNIFNLPPQKPFAMPETPGKQFFAVDECVAAAVLLRCRTLTQFHVNPMVVITPQLDHAEELLRQLRLFNLALGANLRILLLPEAQRGNLYFAGSEAERSHVLNRMVNRDFDLVVTSAGGFLAEAPRPEQLRKTELVLRTGAAVDYKSLLEQLVQLDYDDEFEVASPGEFARRGGIVDIFSPDEEFPGRIEFFGDEIDSIRLFSPETQRSIRTVTSYRVVNRCTRKSIENLRNPNSDSSAEAKDKAEGTEDEVENDLSNYCYFLNLDCALFFPGQIADYLARYENNAATVRFQTFRAGYAATGRLWTFYGASEALDNEASEARNCGLFPATAHLEGVLPREAAERSMELYRQQMALQLQQWADSQYHIFLSCADATEQERAEAWLESLRNAPSGKTIGENLECIVADLPSGFLLPEEKIALVTTRELLGTGSEALSRRRRAGKRTLEAESSDAENVLPTAEEMKDAANPIVADLDEGDYAVHLAHGIGIFRGIRTVTQRTTGEVKEVMVLEYADGALLHVDLAQSSSVSRYIGSGKAAVKLHRLGSSKWNRDKQVAMRAVRCYAADMLRLRAVREAAQALPMPDSVESQAAERDFADRFSFQETPDQLRSIVEIRADLGSGKPMDRLLCGDVGYGKTEVAMRAAFHLVHAGYQVALMAPTTVLAQQHFYSFKERFAAYPYTIEMLSRFRSLADQKKVMANLASGGVDIVIGTHRLASRDLKFSNLGLVIVDEEQRFGVKVKERLVELRTDVNVLAMSATPIPRTLYLAMAGARDLSTIMSAPVARLPVKTIVMREDAPSIAEAIRREVARGGQVYYLHNRVHSIGRCAEKLRALLPDVSIDIAHGQMEEQALEAVMSRFLSGALQVLVSTTIVESGLDVPNANTIIIERADRFGLAELYQLRGRVGRWTHQAYAYLVLPKNDLITPDGHKRIAAIRRYTQLGAGLKLALRDLEIRGAGNLLGSEQSGHIAMIGFELYCRLLKDEVARLKHQSSEYLHDVELSLDFLTFSKVPPAGLANAEFPESYIPILRLRIAAYRKLGMLSSEAMVEDFRKELIDRFGKLPDAAELLLKTAAVKILAARNDFFTVSSVEGKLYLRDHAGNAYRSNGRIPQLDVRKSVRIRLDKILSLLRMIQLEHQQQ